MMAVEEGAGRAPTHESAEPQVGSLDDAAAEVPTRSVEPSGATVAPVAGEVSGSATHQARSSDVMTITFKLYATLQDLLPRGAVKNAVQIDVATDTTLYEIIDRFQVPRDLAHLVLVNGVFFCDADRNEKGLLKPGDVLAIWPPVAGG